MKLSEAMRLGATMKPQHFGEMLSYDKKRTCALGGAYDAIGALKIVNDPMFIYTVDHTFYKRWAILDVRTICPDCSTHNNMGLDSVIVHLNDFHKWTREKIADFVELEEARFPHEAPEEIPDPIPSPSEAPLEVA